MAALDVGLWTQLFSLNAPALTACLDTLLENLKTYKVQQQEEERLEAEQRKLEEERLERERKEHPENSTDVKKAWDDFQKYFNTPDERF